MSFINKELQAALRLTVPVLLGYLAIGLAFGLLLSAARYPWWLALVMSLVVYAGAAQYMAVNLLVANVGLAEAALLTLAVNARHMVYGVSLLERFRGLGAKRAYLIFALTDETYALLTGMPERRDLDRGRLYAWISALDQFYWVAGSAAGALAGNFLPMPTKGLDFALTALFAVLLVEQARVRIHPPAAAADAGGAGDPDGEADAPEGRAEALLPFALAAAACALAWLAFGAKGMLLPAIGLSIAGLLAAELVRRRRAR